MKKGRAWEEKESRGVGHTFNSARHISANTDLGRPDLGRLEMVKNGLGGRIKKDEDSTRGLFGPKRYVICHFKDFLQNWALSRGRREKDPQERKGVTKWGD